MTTRLLFFLFISVLFIPMSKAETKAQHLKIALRTIGHEFLLQTKDSTSRILAIEKMDGRYAVQFEKPLSFEPELLSFAVYKVLKENNINDSYIVEVEKCGTKEVIYSFEASLKKNDSLTTCKLRVLPKNCYVFYFTLIENTKGTAPIVIVESPTLNYIYAIILILGGALIVYLIRRKSRKKLKSNLINIGQFQFDQKGMKLTLRAQSIELSTKESDLLLLLFSNENKTLEREYILNIIWGDEGDYVGRTLDVFISKLRKKLEADSSLKIINVRGVGYRFVIN